MDESYCTIFDFSVLKNIARQISLTLLCRTVWFFLNFFGFFGLTTIPLHPYDWKMHNRHHKNISPLTFYSLAFPLLPCILLVFPGVWSSLWPLRIQRLGETLTTLLPHSLWAPRGHLVCDTSPITGTTAASWVRLGHPEPSFTVKALSLLWVLFKVQPSISGNMGSSSKIVLIEKVA